MKLRALLATVLIVGAVAACGGDDDADDTSAPAAPAEASGTDCPTLSEPADVVLAGTRIAPWAPVLLAMENGAFEEANLNVTLEPISGPDAIPPLSQGRVDAALGQFAGGFLNARESGIDLRMVWSAYQGNPDSREGYWVRTDVAGTGEEPDIAAFEGETFGSLTTGTGTAALVMARELAKADLTLGDVTFTQLAGPDALVALKNGSVAGAWLVDPVWREAEEDPNLRFLASYPDGQNGAGLVAGPHLLDRPEVLQVFLEVVSNTIREHLTGNYLEDADTVDALAQALDTTPEQLTSALPLVFDADLDLSGSPDFIDDLEQLLKDQDVLEYDTPIGGDAVVDDSFATAAVNCSGEQD